MRRLVLGLATLLVGSAHAQSAPPPPALNAYVTLDGGMQSLSRNAAGERQTEFQDSPAVSNRFGLRAGYPLGGEVRLAAQLEGRYFLNGGSAFRRRAEPYANEVSRRFDRLANLGLATADGSIRLGFVGNPMAAAFVAGDIRPSINSGSGIFAWYQNRRMLSTCAGTTCDFTYLRNALTAESARWQGWAASAFIVPREKDQRGMGLALGFDTEPWQLNLGAQQMDDANGTRLGRVWLVNAGWRQGAWAVKAGSTQFRQWADDALRPAQTNALHSLGASVVPAPGWTVYAAAYHHRRRGRAELDVSLLSLGLDRQIGERLTLYLIATQARNGAAATQSAGFYTLTAPPGSTNSALTIGLRTRFDMNWAL